MPINRRNLALSTLPLLLAAACGDDAPDPTGGGGQGPGSSSSTAASTTGSGGSGGGGLQVVWTPCPLSSDDETGDDAFCATVPVPLHWDDPTGETIDFFVKKVPAAEQPARGQLWLLNGGPGYSGADFEGFFKAQTYDLYLPDHRGTGRSSRLACPEAEDDASPDGFWVNGDELPGCVDQLVDTWGTSLSGFTMTNAARDVGEVIEATRVPDQRVIVFGASYGSMWGNRYLQIYPDRADGAVLDAFAVGLLMTRDDEYFDALGERWMQACAADAACSAKLGGDPWAVMTQAIDGLESGSCPDIAAQGWTRADLHQFWSFFFYQWDLRALVAPMVYRLARCEPRDVAAFQNIVDVFSQPGRPSAAQRYFSMMLSTHIMLSEMWEDPPPSVAELEAFQAGANVAHGLAAPAQGVYDAWPRYAKDAYADGLAQTATPMLMMRGAYDFIPLSEIQPAIDHFAAGGATFVEIPNAPHGAGAAPQQGGGPSCAGQVLGQFLAEPTATLDASCVDQVAPLPLVPPAGLSAAVFGVGDPWDGAPSSATSDVADRAAIEAERHRLRRAYARFPR